MRESKQVRRYLGFLVCGLAVFFGGCEGREEVAAPDTGSRRLEKAVVRGGEGEIFPIDPIVVAPVLACNDQTTKFTTEGSGVTNSSGEGGTLNDAMNNTVENAILDNVLNQFSCEECPGEFPCEPFYDESSVDTAGAYFAGNPATDCSQQPDGTWECHGDVDFNTGGGNPKPSAKAGCKNCDDSWN